MTLNATTTDGSNKAIIINVTDTYGNQASNVTYITIDATGPSVIAGANQTKNVSAQVTFDGSSSSDATAGVATYEWDYTTDGTYDVNSTDSQANYTYVITGVKTVTLRVCDAAGNCDTNTTYVNVTSAVANNIAPTGQDVIFPSNLLVNSIDGLNLTVNFTDYGNDSSSVTSAVGSTVLSTTFSYFTLDLNETGWSDTVQVNFSIYNITLGSLEQGDVRLAQYSSGAW
jgi:hypothetical protein